MPADAVADDVRAIKALIARQFASLGWSPGSPADWDGFAAGFLPDAALYPAARPAAGWTVPEFIARMRRRDPGERPGTGLRAFHETLLGVKVRVFGHVAMAVAACEMLENGTDRSRSVEMLLLVKTDGEWRIAAQAWDTEAPARSLPADLLARPEPPSGSGSI